MWRGQPGTGLDILQLGRKGGLVLIFKNKGQAGTARGLGSSESSGLQKEQDQRASFRDLRVSDRDIFCGLFYVTLHSPHLSQPYRAQPSFTYHPEKEGGEGEGRNEREGKGIHPMFRSMLPRVTLAPHFFLTSFCFWRLASCCGWKTSGWCPHF